MLRIPLTTSSSSSLGSVLTRAVSSTTSTPNCNLCRVETFRNNRTNKGNQTSTTTTLIQKCFFSANFPDSGMFDKVAFIGSGKMAQAMIQPMIDTNLQPEERVAVYDVSVKAVQSLTKKYPKVQVANSIADLVKDADFVVCCVKPQNVDAKFYQQFPKANIRDDATLLSILAGTALSKLEPTGFSKIVRSMPNTPATIGQGMTVWSCTENLTSQDRAHVKGVLETFGKAVRGRLVGRLVRCFAR
jgi:hypothetical protein